MVNARYFAAMLMLLIACQTSATNSQHEVNLIIPTDEVDIGGTLVVPHQLATQSLVIMLSGSGPQDRDETLDGFKVLGEMAELLAMQGIASFRFDDRGVGQSTGDFNASTLKDHARDVHDIMGFFSGHSQHPFSDFVLLGHSQGGIVSARVAVSNPNVKKVVLMGAPSVPLIDIVLYQVRLEHDPRVVSKAMIEQEVSAHNRLMWAIESGKHLEAARRVFKQSSEALLSLTSSPDDGNANKISAQAEAKTREFELIYALPSLTSFLYHDSAQDYVNLTVPVLSLFGGKDLQVTIEQNKDVMEKALLRGQVPYAFVTFDAANHYFQSAVTGHREEYEKLEPRFIDGFADTVGKWIVTD